MSTVPGPDTPAPANNAKTLTLSHDPGLYARPTAGGNAVGDNTPAPSGPTPGYSINMTGAAVENGGPNMGHGATQVVAQPDATGHPTGDVSGGGTVGDSGSQGA